MVLADASLHSASTRALRILPVKLLSLSQPAAYIYIYATEIDEGGR